MSIHQDAHFVLVYFCLNGREYFSYDSKKSVERLEDYQLVRDFSKFLFRVNVCLLQTLS